MSRKTSFTSDEYNELPVEELVDELADVRSVRLHIDKPVKSDGVRSFLVLSAIARADAVLEIEFPFGTASREVADSLDACLLGPFLWSSAPRRNLKVSVNAIGQPDLYYADPQRNLLFTHTSALSSRNREEFRTDLALAMRRAAIFVPESVFNALSLIGFELNSNAEEYGALNEFGEEVPTFRVFAVSIQPQLQPEVATLATTYLEQYASTHTSGDAWLQVIVADAGVGMAYPSYFVRESSDSRVERNIYSVTPAEEQAQLRLVLEDYTSTKRTFGRRLNLQTAVGEGTKIVRFQIAGVRGFAGVRTGRCTAMWWHTSRTLTAEEFHRLGRFEVQSASAGPLRGTVWQVLIPLDTQFGLL